MKMSFWEVFKSNHDGSLSLLREVSVNGVKYEKGHVVDKPLGGVNFSNHIGVNLEVEVGELKIKGIYE